MKLKVIPSIVALALCALFAYGMYSWCKCADMNMLMAVFGGVGLLLTIGTTLGVSMPETRTTVNVKVLSGVFALLLIIDNIVFGCLSSFSAPLYIIVNGVVLLIWFICLYGIARAQK